jgi:hypothetical protein
MSETDIESESVLTVKQLAVIAALVEGLSQRDAAKVGKVDERTIYRWLRTPLFLAELKKSEADILGSVVWQLSEGHALVLDTVKFLMEKSKSDATRLNASIAWSNMFIKYREVFDISERLKVLEAHFSKSNSTPIRKGKIL